MASPFADLTNMRLRWDRQGAPIDLRDGPSQPGESIVIEAFAKAPSISAPSQQGGVQFGPGGCSLYVVRFTALPQGADWLGTGAGWVWNVTGIRPPGLAAGARLQAFFGDLGDLPVVAGGEEGWLELNEINPPFGDGGIGAEKRTALGDQLIGTLSLNR